MICIDFRCSKYFILFLKKKKLLNIIIFIEFSSFFFIFLKIKFEFLSLIGYIILEKTTLNI